MPAEVNSVVKLLHFQLVLGKMFQHNLDLHYLKLVFNLDYGLKFKCRQVWHEEMTSLSWHCNLFLIQCRFPLQQPFIWKEGGSTKMFPMVELVPCWLLNLLQRVSISYHNGSTDPFSFHKESLVKKVANLSPIKFS